MTWQELIDRLFLQVDDLSQLSTAEALVQINEIYWDVQDDRDWEWLRTSYSWTTSTSVPYVALPADFKNMCPNYMTSIGLNFGNVGVPVGWTWNMYSSSVSGANSSVVFVGTTFSPYLVIPFSQRNNYRNASNVCYIDIPNQRLVFTLQPTSAQAITYDYIKVAADILIGTSPIFRAWLHNILAFGAAARFDNLQLTDKASSYQRENQSLFDKGLSSLRLEDANIKTSLA